MTRCIRDDHGVIHICDGLSTAIDNMRSYVETACGDSWTDYTSSLDISSKNLYVTCFACLEAERVGFTSKSNAPGERTQRVQRAQLARRLRMR
jgi:hypothetical protein